MAKLYDMIQRAQDRKTPPKAPRSIPPQIEGELLGGKQSRKRGRPLAKDRANTLAALKPWNDLGMSRRTWYRRQAKENAL